MDLLKYKVDINDEIDVDLYLQLYYTEIEIILKRKDALEKLFKKLKLTKIPGIIFWEKQYTLKSDGKINQLRKTNEFIKLFIENLIYQLEILKEIRSGKREKRK